MDYARPRRKFFRCMLNEVYDGCNRYWNARYNTHIHAMAHHGNNIYFSLSLSLVAYQERKIPNVIMQQMSLTSVRWAILVSQMVFVSRVRGFFVPLIISRVKKVIASLETSIYDDYYCESVNSAFVYCTYVCGFVTWGAINTALNKITPFDASSHYMQFDDKILRLYSYCLRMRWVTKLFANGHFFFFFDEWQIVRFSELRLIQYLRKLYNKLFIFVIFVLFFS